MQPLQPTLGFPPLELGLSFSSPPSVDFLDLGDHGQLVNGKSVLLILVPPTASLHRDLGCCGESKWDSSQIATWAGAFPF